jgi:hypothetical protein
VTETVAVRPAPVPEAELPRAPSLGAALRAGASDFYFHSWRVVPTNLVFGVWLLVVVAAWAWIGSLVAMVLAAGLAWPLAGLFRLGAQATRGLDVNLSDALDPARAAPVRLLGVGLAFAAVVLVLTTNLVTGLLIGGLLAWVVATAALWGLIALVVFGFAFWPLLVDPVRDGVAWRARAQLAAMLLLAHPLRVGGLALVLSVILVASTALVAALLTVAVAYVALVACRYVLPAADRLEARLRPTG